MNTKLKASNDDPRALTRTLFNHPFNPSVNFAIEDPLLLSSHPAVQKEGLDYARYFCSNSPLSCKAPEFLQKKLQVEELFSKKMGFEKSVILPSIDAPLELIRKSFLSSQIYFLPDSMQSIFSAENITYFSHENPRSLQTLLEVKKLDHCPIVYMPKLSASYGRVDFALFAEIKNIHPFFFIIEDSHLFGLEGLDGFAPKSESLTIDLLITHIPKTFGKMLTILSGPFNLLDRIVEFSFENSKIFPSAPYLGMLKASLDLLSSMQDRRDQIRSYVKKLQCHLHPEMSIPYPLITITPHSLAQKTLSTKFLTDNGFLLPSSAFKSNDLSLTLHVNHLLEETSIHFLNELSTLSHKQTICESI